MSFPQLIKKFSIIFFLILSFSSIIINNTYLSFLLSLSTSILIFQLVISSSQNQTISPLFVTSLYLILAYPLKFYAIRLNMPYLKDEFNLLSNDDLMIELFLGLTLGVISFIFAFKYPPKGMLNYLKGLNLDFRVRFDKLLPTKIFMIYLIGLSSLLVQILIGFYSSFAGLGANYDPRFNVIFYNFSEYQWYGLLAGFLWICEKNKVKTVFGSILFLIMLSLSLLLNIFFLASKTYMLYPFLFMYFAFVLKNVKIKKSVLFVIISFVVFVAFIYVPQYRDNFDKVFLRGQNELKDYVSTGFNTLEDISKKPPEIEKVISSIIHRFSGIDITAVVFSSVPSRYEYFYFEQALIIFYNFIPRLIYPSKPVMPKSHYFNIEIAGMIYGGAAAPTPLGEGFVNLGYLGVVILFGLWGSILSLLYNGFFLPRKNNFLIQLIYVVYSLGIIGFGQWIVVYIAGIFQTIFFTIPLILILRNKE